MRYYAIWVRSNRFQGTSALTYGFDGELAAGKIVRVQLQQETVHGIVTGIGQQPRGVTVKTIEHILDLPPLPKPLLELARWLQAYYPASIGSISQLLIPAHLPRKLPSVAATTRWQPAQGLPPLTEEQAEALKRFSDEPDSYLLHGRTGSGKTRLYQELAGRSLAAGRSVIILSPEIGLTSQLAVAFRVFGDNTVAILHSQLSPAERFRAWHRLLTTTTPLIVVGARSALFAPLKDIGLIIMDESHEPAYKQEQQPYYQTARVAARASQLHHASFLQGTATPLVTEYFLAEQKQKPIIRLQTLAQSADYPSETTVVDLKDRQQFTKSPYLSDQLLSSLRMSLSQNEQSLLYLNRRGTARVSLCQNCGWQALCPNCDLPLTYHDDSFNLRCHVCGYSAAVPTRCPTCHHTDLVFRSIGTKAVATEVERLFPEAKVMRFDSDNSKAERFEQHYSSAASGDIDILIGTQTLAKGLDLPRLSTLGVIIADTSLYMPDYTAQERTYQLLNQVLGRVSRGHRASRAIIQTYQPDDPIIAAAISDDWPTFYRQELSERKLFKYPPYVSVLKVSFRRASAKSAEAAAAKVKNAIQLHDSSVTVDGPAPALHEKNGGKYSWQLVVKSNRRSQLLDILSTLPKGNYTYDIDPVDLT